MRVKEEIITEEFLDNNPDVIFVFGDNTKRVGMGGAAILRYHPQAWGFITKINPSHYDDDYYTPNNYSLIFEEEMLKLHKLIQDNPNKKIYVTKLGAGLANQYGIWESIIKPQVEEQINHYNNVYLLWD